MNKQTRTGGRLIPGRRSPVHSLLLTSLLAFPAGLGLGHTVLDARASTCPGDVEAFSLELGLIDVEGDPEPSLLNLDWPSEAKLTALEDDRDTARLNLGADGVLHLVVD